MTRRPAHILWALVAAVMLCLVFHVAVGTSQVLSASSVVSEILRGPYSLQGDNFIVWQFRLPRALECVLVGGLLGTVGSVFQALLRNPLADPYIVGVSSGAAVGGAFVLVLGVGESFGNLGIAAGGCVTGVLTLVLVYRLSLRRGVVDVRASSSARCFPPCFP
jgi:iron complex transport system permease protein